MTLGTDIAALVGPGRPLGMATFFQRGLPMATGRVPPADLPQYRLENISLIVFGRLLQLSEILHPGFASQAAASRDLTVVATSLQPLLVRIQADRLSSRPPAPSFDPLEQTISPAQADIGPPVPNRGSNLYT